MTTTDLYAAEFRRSRERLPGRGSGWLERARGEAVSIFCERGFPTDREEEWRFTDVGPIVEASYRFDVGGGPLPTGWAEPIGGMIFVNGRPVGDGARHVRSLAKHLEGAETFLGRLVDLRKHVFAAINTSLWPDGAIVHVPRGEDVADAVRLVFLTTGAAEGAAIFPRILIVAEAGSRVSVIEEHATEGDPAAWTNSVTEVFAAEGATVAYALVQRQGVRGMHVANLAARLERHAVLTAHVYTEGGGLVRNDTEVRLEGEGADCGLYGLYFVDGRRHVDNHTVIDHARPHGTSRELYKGILDGQARAVFNGRIVVRPGAAKSDALQTNKNLVLSRGAIVNTNPQLEIFANDVRCKHGATVGRLAEDQSFYLRSRGIDPEAARRMLMFGFAQEVVARASAPAIRGRLAGLLSERFSGPGAGEEGES